MNVGITGHQELGDESTIKWIEQEMSKELDKLIIEQAFSSLAIGADQLFASLILSKKIPLIAVTPCYDYEKTFSSIALIKYRSLLKKVSQVVQLDNKAPSESAFYEAGLQVVDRSDIIFAVWDARPSKGLGGTADIVAYALSKNKQLIHFNPLTQSTKYIHF